MPPDLIGACDGWIDGIDWSVFGVWVGSIAALIAAVGTVGALLHAIRTANAARRDALDLRREQQERDKRAQAVTICAWIRGQIGHPTSILGSKTIIRLVNSSSEPAYDAVVYFVWVQGGGVLRTGRDVQKLDDAGRLRAIVQVLPPGTFDVTIEGPIYHPSRGRPSVEMAFTDAAGNHWLRTASGNLSALDESAYDYYALSRPLPAFAFLDPAT